MNKIKALYHNAKTAKIGEKCICPSCGNTFIKNSYQQVFCKTYKGTICKDKYWNTVTLKKRCNTTRISPANKSFYDNRIVNYNYDDGIDYLLDSGDR